jgi:hypothetical protein
MRTPLTSPGWDNFHVPYHMTGDTPARQGTTESIAKIIFELFSKKIKGRCPEFVESIMASGVLKARGANSYLRAWATKTLKAICKHWEACHQASKSWADPSIALTFLVRRIEAMSLEARKLFVHFVLEYTGIEYDWCEGCAGASKIYGNPSPKFCWCEKSKGCGNPFYFHHC